MIDKFKKYKVGDLLFCYNKKDASNSELKTGSSYKISKIVVDENRDFEAYIWVNDKLYSETGNLLIAYLDRFFMTTAEIRCKKLKKLKEYEKRR